MICKCQYFSWKDGKLVCSVCGKPSGKQAAVEDKVIENHEVKAPAKRGRR